MKTCKKILAGVLVFAMMLSMCAFVSADEVAETATNVLLTLHDFDSAAVGTYKTGTAANDGLNKTALHFRAIQYGTNGITTGTVTQKTEGDNYLVAQSNWFGYNYRKSDTVFNDTYGVANYPVLSISYDVMIPDNVDYKEFKRYGSLAVGTTKTGGYTTAATVYPSIENGILKVTTEDSTEKYSKSLTYTYGSWVNFNTLVWVNDSNNLNIAVYADDTLVYYGVGTKTVTGLAMADMNFGYYNDLEGTTRISDATAANWSNGVHTDATTGKVDSILSTTCYDDITVQLLPESAKVSEDYVNDLIAEQKARTPYIRLLEYTGDTLDSGYVKDGVGTSGKDVFDSTGSMKYSLVQAGATDDHAAAAYTVVEETDRTYTNVTTSSFRYLLANVRDSFADYVQKGNGDMGTFVYSNDLNLKDLNASVKGQFSFGLDLSSNDTVDPTNPTGDKILARKTNDVVINYTISTDGKISFDGGVTGYGSIKTGTLRSESRDVTVGDWINVKMVFEITHGETEYVIKAYGIYEDDVIYENEFGLTYADYDKDGVTDDIHIGMVYLQLGTDNKNHTETVTGVDNFYFDKNDNFDWSAINTDAWLNRVVEISKDASGNVDVYAKKSEGAFTNETLVIAICNANGTVKEVITSNAVAENGTMSYEVPASKVTAGNIVKGFVFDSLTSAKPQMPKGTYIVK